MNLTSGSVPILPERLDWPSAIGNLLLNFGTLDYHVYALLEDRLPPDEYSKVKEWHFNDRINWIAKFLDDNRYPVEERAAFARLVDRIEPIRELRNHIAHGQMYVSMDPATQKLTVTILTAKDASAGAQQDTRHVEFAELERALTTLPNLIEEFGRLAGFTWDEAVDVGKVS